MKMRKALFLVAVGAGVTAAYLMQKRGESLVSIVRKTVSNPFGALVDEAKIAFLPALNGAQSKSLPSSV